jgi:hypothetical protein
MGSMKVALGVSVAEGALGAVLAAVPATVAGKVAGTGKPAPSWLVRALGIRMLVQSAAVSAFLYRGKDGRQALQAGAGVDAVHAASMVGAASLWPSYRRSAAASAVLAGTSALAGWALSRGA